MPDLHKETVSEINGVRELKAEERAGAKIPVWKQEQQ